MKIYFVYKERKAPGDWIFCAGFSSLEEAEQYVKKLQAKYPDEKFYVYK